MTLWDENRNDDDLGKAQLDNFINPKKALSGHRYYLRAG